MFATPSRPGKVAGDGAGPSEGDLLPGDRTRQPHGRRDTLRAEIPRPTLVDLLELTALIALKQPQRPARVSARWLQRWLEASDDATIYDISYTAAAPVETGPARSISFAGEGTRGSRAGSGSHGLLQASIADHGAGVVPCRRLRRERPLGLRMRRGRAWLLVRDARHGVFLPDHGLADRVTGGPVAGVEPADPLRAGPVAAHPRARAADGEAEPARLGDSN